MKNLLRLIIYAISIFLIAFSLLYIVTYHPNKIMEWQDPYHKDRPVAEGSSIMVASGHPFATRVALDILKNGGTAADAGVAALLVLNVTQGEEASFPGVAPLLYFNAQAGKVESYIGAGKAPKKATIEYFKSRGYKTVPILQYSSQLIPASPDVIISLLKKYGTMSFSEVSAPAIRIAEEGFPVHKILLRNINMNFFKRLGFSILLPYNAEVYLRGRWWRPLHLSERFTRPDLAKTFRELAAVEVSAKKAGKNRESSLEAVRDHFYKGPIAKRIVEAHQKYDGTMILEDFTRYTGSWEEPLTGTFGSYKIYSNRTWNQGAVVPIVLQILDGIDLKSMGHNSSLYVHTVIQAIELAMADREKFFGDPEFTYVPIGGLLNKEYAESRKRLLQKAAFGKTPPHGNPFEFESTRLSSRTLDAEPKENPREGYVAEMGDWKIAPSFWEKTGSGKIGRDTTYLSIIDSKGNSLSLTPSDFPQSPMIDGDLTLGIRMTQFRLDPLHPSSLVPGKRPTITPNASMVFKEGKFFMSLGTPGGDMQTQGIIQTFLNIVVFGMNPQEAVNAPRFRSLNWPDSFSPHTYYPGRIELEKDIYDRHADALKAIGYDVQGREKWEYDFGAPCVSLRDPKTGKLFGGADPRKESWAEGQ
ncbi:putative gamma-glutamyltransferase [Leptospira broomii serovar Hurstbridge str. 5399]|uniref:Gamma-glutamyltransferase n=1 Tax=Leptospira broomii serovar Hurstbridge str. 5399 TaxID=1049789 RepID=T0FBJ8_9LEPT|nr:gamma-glutamyltransferase [Leptospira broomii]EQA44952.1 putative gamma-glutamyltransferase [Leptospira broomii serovar Hurstbridge str. 5399]